MFQNIDRNIDKKKRILFQEYAFFICLYKYLLMLFSYLAFPKEQVPG